MEGLGALLGLGFVTPLLVGGAVMLAARARSSAALAALALPVAAMAGRLAWGGAPRLPPLDSVDWPLWLALLTPALLLTGRARALAQAVLVALGLGLELAPLLGSRAPGTGGLALILGISALGAAVGASFQASSGSNPKRAWATAAALSAALALSLALTGSVRLGGLALSLCAATLPVAGMSGLVGPERAAAAAPAFSLLFLGLAAAGSSFSATPIPVALALSGALAATALPRLALPVTIMLGLTGLFLAWRETWVPWVLLP